MPHSTVFATTASQSDQLQPLNSSLASSGCPSSVNSLKPPIKLSSSPASFDSSRNEQPQQSQHLQYQPPQNNSQHYLLATRGGGISSHGRSKSTSAAMSTSSTCPSLSLHPPATSGTYRGFPQHSAPPPLLRMSSLPPPTIADRNKSPHHQSWLHSPTTSPASQRSMYFPRSASPTRIFSFNNNNTLAPSGSTPRSVYYPISPRAPSPPAHFVNEPIYPFLGTSTASSSSSPSTPSSMRSRSPSISSLETIPDTPDAEQEAVEAELREALERKSMKMESEEEEEGGSRRRRSLDFDRGSLRWSGADKRKRWSVCGGEKRGDLDLETIWEEALSGVDNGTSRDSEEADEGEETEQEETVRVTPEEVVNDDVEDDVLREHLSRKPS